MAKKRIVQIASVILLAVLAIAIMLVASKVVEPQDRWSDEAVTESFYSQPDNTIQVAFLGTSNVRAGFSPMQLYKDHGICSFTFGTGSQPIMGSYYWLKEAYRLHGGSLRAVVLDPSALVYTDGRANASSKIERALINMRISPVKIEAALDVQRRYSGLNALDMLFPVLRYHSRWSELNAADFENPSATENTSYTHGQRILFGMDLNNYSADKQQYPVWDLTESIDYSDEELEEMGVEYSVEYLEKIVDFCNEHGLDLVLAKVPRYEWTDKQHDCIQYFADKFGVALIDYNFPEVLEEYDWLFPTDAFTRNHPNVYGMRKVTGVIGDYLVDHCDIKDIRDDPRYGFMKEDEKVFDEELEDSKLQKCTSFEEYLDLLDKDRYTVFIAVKGEAADGLSDEARAKLEDLGLSGLASLKSGQSYVGTLDGGKVKQDVVESDLKKKATAEGAYHNCRINKTKQDDQPNATVPDGYTLTSGGSKAGNTASIMIDESELSEDKAGINIVVFNKTTRKMIDTSSFNTHEGSDRTSDIVPASYFETYEKLRSEATADRAQ